jgi:8-oxo-dGTP pyrophosphatase MutT (NUDIX family)
MRFDAGVTDEPGEAVRAFDLAGADPWQTRETRTLFRHPQLSVLESRVTQPDGQPGRYVYVQVPRPIVVMVPLDDAGAVRLVRQWRYPWAQNSWELPAGHAEDGETPLAAAQRELAEEALVEAADWTELGEVYGSAGSTGRFHLYLARGLTPSLAGRRDATESDMRLDAVAFAEALAAAADDRMRHTISIVALFRAARLLDSQRERR